MQQKKFAVGAPTGLNGVRHLAYTEWGHADNPHIVICVHGLTRNCRDFDYLAEVLQNDCRVICPDVVGRGLSDWLLDASAYDHYPLYLDDAMALLSHIGVGCDSAVKTVDWVGTSMGGLIGMMLAIPSDLAPAPIRKLVMSDIGPVIPATALGRMADYVGKDIRFDGLGTFTDYLKKISASFGPLSDAQWHHFAIHSARAYPDGRVGFRYDPAIATSFRNHASDADIVLWDQWDQVQAPTLILRGDESDVLSASLACEMQTRGPRAQVIEFAGIGHAPMFVSDDQIKVTRDFLL